MMRSLWAGVSGLIRLEKLGKPGIFVVTDNFAHDAGSSAEDNGMPTVRNTSLFLRMRTA